MSDASADERRLRATETQMRRALGLQNSSVTGATIVPLGLPNGSPPQRRRFVRDGEVSITVMHRDQHESAGANKLESAQRDLREQIAARAHAEQLLQEARATIQNLQTKLAHERFARDDATRQAEAERRAIDDQLAAERVARERAEQERDTAIAAQRKAEQRHRTLMGAEVAQESEAAPVKAKRGRPPGRVNVAAIDVGPAPKAGNGARTVARRRGRPSKDDPSASEFVEWWKPGWRDRYR
jgi:hypothetical protein